ncbi:Membrane-bound lytic murein transglycosylase A [hydrothermal vent metagenome]|uniref:peptidoglycan lytic exotransglycosylase n=1 Tax=hydrothermal vent metagenome TaxID=652676 RepID=A0A3B1BE76_9ZZZZ
MRKSFIIVGAGFLLSLLLFLWVLVKDDALREEPEFMAVSYGDLEYWSSDPQSQALAAFKNSCRIFLSWPATKIISPERLGGRAGDWHPSCQLAETFEVPTDHQAKEFFEQYFTVISYAKDTEGLFTGYFAPEYHGSDKPSAEYNYPLYGLPGSLKTLDLGDFRADLKGKTIIGEVRDGAFVPYKDREIIDRGALENQALELVWLKDPVDAFFMHIQGSGIIRYENGDQKLFGYAGKNGKAYHAIGKFLIQSGEIEKQDMSMQAIRGWIKGNPLQAEALMWKNPSYVFFRAMEGRLPVGAMNVELTAGRSLAVDRKFVPLGIPVWLDLKPSTEITDPIRRLVIAQDTGGAIKGRVRGDVYWGIGEDAGLMAGPMKDLGRYYFLLPNELAQKLLSDQNISLTKAGP